MAANEAGNFTAPICLILEVDWISYVHAPLRWWVQYVDWCRSIFCTLDSEPANLTHWQLQKSKSSSGNALGAQCLHGSKDSSDRSVFSRVHSTTQCKKIGLRLPIPVVESKVHCRPASCSSGVASHAELLWRPNTERSSVLCPIGTQKL